MNPNEEEAINRVNRARAASFINDWASGTAAVQQQQQLQQQEVASALAHRQQLASLWLAARQHQQEQAIYASRLAGALNQNRFAGMSPAAVASAVLRRADLQDTVALPEGLAPLDGTAAAPLATETEVIEIDSDGSEEEADDDDKGLLPVPNPLAMNQSKRHLELDQSSSEEEEEMELASQKESFVPPRNKKLRPSEEPPESTLPYNSRYSPYGGPEATSYARAPPPLPPPPAEHPGAPLHPRYSTEKRGGGGPLRHPEPPPHRGPPPPNRYYDPRDVNPPSSGRGRGPPLLPHRRYPDPHQPHPPTHLRHLNPPPVAGGPPPYPPYPPTGPPVYHPRNPYRPAEPPPTTRNDTDDDDKKTRDKAAKSRSQEISISPVARRGGGNSQDNKAPPNSAASCLAGPLVQKVLSGDWMRTETDVAVQSAVKDVVSSIIYVATGLTEETKADAVFPPTNISLSFEQVQQMAAKVVQDRNRTVREAVRMAYSEIKSNHAQIVMEAEVQADNRARLKYNKKKRPPGPAISSTHVEELKIKHRLAIKSMEEQLKMEKEKVVEYQKRADDALKEKLQIKKQMEQARRDQVRSMKAMARASVQTLRAVRRTPPDPVPDDASADI